jgi:hypothetical protein
MAGHFPPYCPFQFLGSISAFKKMLPPISPITKAQDITSYLQQPLLDFHPNHFSNIQAGI